jgi:hypothetical protein
MFSACPKKITTAAIRQMQNELDQLEARGKRELSDLSSRPVGLLRIDLVEECRRRLSFIANTLGRNS